MDNKKILPVVAIIIIAILGGIFGQGHIGHDTNQTSQISSNSTASTSVVESGQYCDKDNVSAYIKKFHKLPSNYITKKVAKQLGWQGGPLKKYAPGNSIGGDTFTNRQAILPTGHKYVECDIDANGTSRGAKRIVYSTDQYKTYYTDDHYNTFTELT